MNVLELCEAIEKLTAGEWRVKDEKRPVHDFLGIRDCLVTDGDMLLRFSDSNEKKDKILITGIWSCADTGETMVVSFSERQLIGNPVFSINVSKNKTPEQIWNDVFKRLLPDARKLHNLSKERAEAWDKANKGKRDTAYYFKDKYNWCLSRDADTTRGQIDLYIPHGTCRIHGRDSISIDRLNVSNDIADKIFQILYNEDLRKKALKI